MSQEDDAIIQAVGDAIAKNGLVGYSAPEYRRQLAKAAIATYLDGLEKAGWKVVPKTWTKPMWQAWEESEGGGEIEFQHVIAASPTPPGAG